jgi:menaquinone-9 beta-reductase
VTERVELVIVGSGPAGLSTALHLLAEDPTWAERMVVLEKGIHPRRKLCAGGITGAGLEILARLGLDLGTPAAAVREMEVRYGASVRSVPVDPPFQVVCREAFDAALCRQAIARGVRVCQSEAVGSLTIEGGRIELTTDRRRWSARAVVAADGSNSTVRRELERLGRLPAKRRRPLARLVEGRSPASGHEPAFREGRVVFDFSAARSHALQGYAWSFPSWVDGLPTWNTGAFDSRASSQTPAPPLTAVVRDFLSTRPDRLPETPDPVSLAGFPLRAFDPAAPLAVPGVLLTGDAAGADPLLGEGISFALAYGEVAASTLARAWRQDDYRFAGYAAAVGSHPLLGQLPQRSRWAGRLYRWRRPWQQGCVWSAFRLLHSLRRPAGTGRHDPPPSPPRC